MVLYQFFHGVSANIMVDRFNFVIFMMCEYVDIVVDFLISRDKLFSWYILHLMFRVYIRLWMDFWMHVIYQMLITSLMDHILHFFKNWISELLKVKSLQFHCFVNNLGYGQIILNHMLFNFQQNNRYAKTWYSRFDHFIINPKPNM